MFNREMKMSLREWSLRLGLLSPGEDDELAWNDREIGQPKNTKEFDQQIAWKAITHPDSKQFKTSQSKGFHISNPTLRFAQVFLTHNLLGQTTPYIITPELYFAWCMHRQIKVHLGYWIAQSCHLIASHPQRHLLMFHLLGAYLERNAILTLPKPAPTLDFCEPPCSFDMTFFVNSKLITVRGQQVIFYEVGKPDWALAKDEQDDGNEATLSGEAWKDKVEELITKLNAMTTAQQKLLEDQAQKMS